MAIIEEIKTIKGTVIWTSGHSVNEKGSLEARILVAQSFWFPYICYLNRNHIKEDPIIISTLNKAISSYRIREPFYHETAIGQFRRVNQLKS